MQPIEHREGHDLSTAIGREINSAALVADGLHARVDGFTSLAVSVGVICVWLGFWWADPLMGFIIGFAILVIVRDAAREMWHRVMDAMDPKTIDQIEHTASHVEGVQGVHNVRARWIGHRMNTEPTSWWIVICLWQRAMISPNRCAMACFMNFQC